MINLSAENSHLHMIGNKGILQSKTLALFCSRRCPGSLILKAYDLAHSLREAGVTVIGGFHTPVEKECLRILLRGKQPLIICPARSIEGMRIPSEWKHVIEQNRLLLLSPFEKKQRRMTAALAEQRNQFVSSIADDILPRSCKYGFLRLFSRYALIYRKDILVKSAHISRIWRHDPILLAR